MKTPFRLSALLAVLMTLQAALGLLVPEQYRDPELIRATWFGNDWITLLLGVPLLIVALRLARRGSTRGTLLWLGMLGYGVYNYSFYLFGAALNTFFPLYVVALVVSALALILALARLPVARTAARFRPTTPVRWIGGYLIFVAVGLTVAWTGMWYAYAFGGTPPPMGPEPFKLVAALDIGLMVPALAGGGVLLWRRRPWGYVVSTIASAQGTLYLLVLSVNSVIGIRRGLAEAPGELPVWGPLLVGTAVATILLLANVRGGEPTGTSHPERRSGVA